MGNISNTAECTIKNKLGLHARPASLFVQTAAKFDCEITVQKEEETANGKSLMSLLVLSAPFGSKLRISASGPDAEEAVKAETGTENGAGKSGAGTIRTKMCREYS